MGYYYVAKKKKFEDKFYLFNTVHECDKQVDRTVTAYMVPRFTCTESVVTRSSAVAERSCVSFH